MNTTLMIAVRAMSLRDMRTFCALYTRDPAMRLWSRPQCIAYVQAWDAIDSAAPQLN